MILDGSPRISKPYLTKLVFLIPSLDKGGAERQLVELVKGIDKSRFALFVVTFYDGGELRSELENLDGVHVSSLRKSGGSNVFWSFSRLWTEARKIQPDVMIGYMSLSSILCLLIGRVVGARVFWSLRSSEVDYERYGWGMRWSFKLAAKLSRFADVIIVNSVAGGNYHRAKGYYEKRMITIPNGIDTNRFRPIPGAGCPIRAQWGIGKNDTVIGLVGRIDVMKDHPTFLRAAAQLAPDHPNVTFLCVGGGSRAYEAELRALGSSLGLGDRLIWVGAQDDMLSVYNALDLLTSSSSGEGFSNVIGEAMACGVPCVVTDVGDSALIVGETGMIVRPRDPAALSDALRSWMSMEDGECTQRRKQARARIEREFDLQAMVTKTEAVLQGALLPGLPTGY